MTKPILRLDYSVSLNTNIAKRILFVDQQADQASYSSESRASIWLQYVCSSHSRNFRRVSLVLSSRNLLRIRFANALIAWCLVDFGLHFKSVEVLLFIVKLDIGVDHVLSEVFGLGCPWWGRRLLHEDVWFVKIRHWSFSKSSLELRSFRLRCILLVVV